MNTPDTTSEETPVSLSDNSGATDATNMAARESNGGREKRSRDRYGRERRPRGERTPEAAPMETGTAVASQTPPTELPEDAAPRRSYFTVSPEAGTTPIEPAAPSTVVQANEPTPTVTPQADDSAAPVTAAESVVTAVAQPAAPIVEPIRVAPVVAAQPYTLPVEDLEQIAQQSGLTWIRSDAEKVAAVQAEIAAQPQPVHVPRERPPLPATDERPLVLVETRRDLRGTALPFETQTVD